MQSEYALLESLKTIADGLGRQFGKNCEVAVHDLDLDPGHTIIYIVNGTITGREKGDGMIPGAGKQIEDLREEEKTAVYTRTRDGRMIRSCSIPLPEDAGRRYLLEVSCDITMLVALDSEIRFLVGSDLPLAEKEPVRHVNDLLEVLIEESIALIGKQPSLMSRDEKVRAIQFLHDSGAFLITRSGERIAQCFGISKFTLYSYIDVSKKKV